MVEHTHHAHGDVHRQGLPGTDGEVADDDHPSL